MSFGAGSSPKNAARHEARHHNLSQPQRDSPRMSSVWYHAFQIRSAIVFFCWIRSAVVFFVGFALLWCFLLDSLCCGVFSLDSLCCGVFYWIRSAVMFLLDPC